MKSLSNMATLPASLPILADDIVEFHAARLLLLVEICGGGSINGLTKLAKLDFFIRYPDFFKAASKQKANTKVAVEAAMVRHHYGPWDKRYYHVLSYLEARGLIKISRTGGTVSLRLTKVGKDAATKLSGAPSFAGLTQHMRDVRVEFGAMKGTQIKDLIYKMFDKEVGQQALGQVIEAKSK